QRGVLFLQRGAGLVERLPDPRRDLLDIGPPGSLRDEKLVLVGVFGIGPLRTKRLALLVEAVGQPLEEEQAEDEVLVVGGVDRAPEDVGRRPEVSLQARACELLADRQLDLLRRWSPSSSASAVRPRGPFYHPSSRQPLDQG